jgi:hypothetical protein
MMDYYYENLFAAIWQQAVKEDIRKVQSRAVRALTSKGVSTSNAKKYINSKGDYIKKKVQENVYKESLEWGSGKSLEIQERNINSLVGEVVDEYKVEVSKANKQAARGKGEVADKS